MTASDHDLLLARLAVHYQLLDEAAMRAAFAAFSSRGAGASFGDFLVAEAIIDGAKLEQLEKARAVYLRRKQGEAKAPRSQAPRPETPQPAAAKPVAAPMVETRKMVVPDADVSLEDLLRSAVERGASDLHVHSGAALRMRIDGKLVELAADPIEAATAETLIHGILAPAQIAQLREEHQLDLVHEVAGLARFRGSIYRQQRGFDAVFRTIPFEVPSLVDLGLPDTVGKLAEYHQGMVLFTGPSGCGKSSTMAAVIDRIARSRAEHILTIEDPVEFVFGAHRALVNQRQVGPHTDSFARALRAALREDPDVIVIGELRDLESVSLALTAAETGHLVLATLHTTGAVRTINRLLGVFPPEEQPQIRTMLSESLRAIVSQHLVPKIGGGRVPALEILLNTPAIANLVRDQKTFQVRSVIQTSAGSGMCLLDASLTALVRAGTVTMQSARAFADEPERLEAGA